MSSLIYTNQKSKLTKKQRAAREALLKEQREIKKSLVGQQDPNRGCASSVVIPEHRSTRHIHSLGTGIGVATKREALMYTGDNMIGIGQMHKSNAVPIFKQDEAKDLANMRR